MLNLWFPLVHQVLKLIVIVTQAEYLPCKTVLLIITIPEVHFWQIQPNLG